MIAPVRSLPRHLWGETLANAQWRDYKATLKSTVALFGFGQV